MASRRAKIGITCIVFGILFVPAYLKYAITTDIWFLGNVSPWYVGIGLIVTGLGIYLTADGDKRVFPELREDMDSSAKTPQMFSDSIIFSTLLLGIGIMYRVGDVTEFWMQMGALIVLGSFGMMFTLVLKIFSQPWVGVKGLIMLLSSIFLIVFALS